MMDAGEAVQEMRAGRPVTRLAWEGTRHVELVRPPRDWVLSEPFFALVPVDGPPGPWVPTHVDLLADDWTLALPGWNA